MNFKDRQICMCRIDDDFGQNEENVSGTGFRFPPPNFSWLCVFLLPVVSFAFLIYPVALVLLLIHICFRRRIRKLNTRSSASLIPLSDSWMCPRLNGNSPSKSNLSLSLISLHSCSYVHVSTQTRLFLSCSHAKIAVSPRQLEYFHAHFFKLLLSVE